MVTRTRTRTAGGGVGGALVPARWVASGLRVAGHGSTAACSRAVKALVIRAGWTRTRKVCAVAAGLAVAASLTGCQLHNKAPVPVSLYEKVVPTGRLTGQVAYVTGRGTGISIIRIVDMATDQAHDVPTPRGWVTDLAWSPDGSLIAFGFSQGGESATSHIWVMAPDGSGLRQVTSGSSSGMDPSWSPNSSSIVFSSLNAATGGWALETVPASGGTPTVLHVSGNSPRYPAWSPNGSTIIYSARRGAGAYKLWSYDIARGTSRQLTRGPGNDLFPSFNSAGNRLAFSSTRSATSSSNAVVSIPGQWQTYIMDIGNGRIQQLISSDSNEQWPVWSPAGDYIMVSVPHLAVYAQNGKKLPGGALRWRILHEAQWSPSWK